MSEVYDQLLEATIQHLEGLKARGVRFISVQPEGLTALKGAPRQPDPAPAAVRVPPSPAPAFRQAATTPPAPAPKPVETPVAKPVFPSATPMETQIVAATLSPEAKAAAFAELHSRAVSCVKCPHLAAS